MSVTTPSLTTDTLRSDAIASLAVTLAGHFLILLLLMTGPDPGNRGRDTGASVAGTFTVDFIAVAKPPSMPKPRRQAAALTQVPALVPVPTAMPSPQTPEQPSSKESVTESGSFATTPQAAKGEQGAKGDYLAVLKQAVLARLPQGFDIALLRRCELVLNQTTGGQLNSSAGKCGLDDHTARALEAAALMAQPLPYQGYEADYRDQVSLTF